MPAPRRHITTAAHTGQCNCDICSGAVAQARHQAILPPGPRRRMPQEPDDEECPPCAKRRIDIILRNKRAVKILSRKLQEQKALTEDESNSTYGVVKLLPTLQHARKRRLLPDALSSARNPRWPEAFKAARTPCTTTKPQKECKVQPKEKPSLLNLLTDRRDCACELMAHTIRADLHRHLALTAHRADINAGLILTPSEPSLEAELDLKTKK